MITPTDKDRARARALRRGPRHTPGEPEDGWIARVEEFGAQCMAAERARIVEALKALRTHEMQDSWSGACMVRRDDAFGDYYLADDIHELLGWDPTEPEGGTL